MKRILFSTGALLGRPNGRDFKLLSECAPRLNCDGFEFMMYDTWYDKLDEIREFMKGLSLSLPSFHVEKQVGELISRNEIGDTKRALELFEINCALASELGAERLVLHLWNGIHSDKDISHNIECYAPLRKISDSYGLELTVENVVCNHADPMTHLCALAMVYPDIKFTFDTKMAAFHSQLEQLYDEKNRWLLPHITHMHINDYSGGYKDWGNLKTLHIGNGKIDFDRLFAFLKEFGYEGDFTIEATSFDQSGKIDLDSLNEDFKKIEKILF